MRQVEELWDIIDVEVERLRPLWGKMVIYQDGLFTSTSSLFPYFKRVASRGSRNIQLILKLLDHGARLRKTERLAMVDMAAMLAQLEGNDLSLGQRRRYDEVCQILLLLRDEYIAYRINLTLRADQVGLLFLGAAHQSFKKHLASDIRVKTVISKKLCHSTYYGTEW